MAPGAALTTPGRTTSRPPSAANQGCLAPGGPGRSARVLVMSGFEVAISTAKANVRVTMGWREVSTRGRFLVRGIKETSKSASSPVSAVRRNSRMGECARRPELRTCSIIVHANCARGGRWAHTRGTGQCPDRKLRPRLWLAAT